MISSSVTLIDDLCSKLQKSFCNKFNDNLSEDFLHQTQLKYHVSVFNYCHKKFYSAMIDTGYQILAIE